MVWRKSSNEIKAIIEIKKAWSTKPLLGDRDKVAKYLKDSGFTNVAAYLLAYTEATREDTLPKRFGLWAEKLKCSNFWTHVVPPQNDEKWGWGVCLLRFDAFR